MFSQSIKIPAILIILILGLIGCSQQKSVQNLNVNLSSPLTKINSIPEGSDNILPNKSNQSNNILGDPNQLIWHIKAVPANISQTDLDLIQQTGFKILGPEWGINDVDFEDVNNLLDRLEIRQLKLILDAGLSLGAWGYQDDGTDPENQPPVWQKTKVQNWVKQFKDHPALFGWDISNEAGENLPNGDRFRITLDQLKTAAADVRAIDPNHPIIIRTHCWDEYDSDFDWKNPFAAGIADIVILNLYSNYSQDGQTAFLPKMITDSAQELVDKILAIDPQVQVWISLAAFEELPMFIRPSQSDLQRDIQVALQVKNIHSLGFFGWQDENSGWDLPHHGPDLIKTIQHFTTTQAD